MSAFVSKRSFYVVGSYVTVEPPQKPLDERICNSPEKTSQSVAKKGFRSGRNSPGRPRSGRVTRSIRAYPEVFDRLKCLAKKLGSSECELFEALVSMLDQGLKGISQPIRIAENIYLFNEFHLHRETDRPRRLLRMREITKEIQVIEEPAYHSPIVEPDTSKPPKCEYADKFFDVYQSSPRDVGCTAFKRTINLELCWRCWSSGRIGIPI